MRVTLISLFLVLFVPFGAANALHDVPVLIITDEVVMNPDLPEEEQFVSLFQQQFDRYLTSKAKARYISIQQPGLTSNGVLQIMPSILEHRPHVAVVALGFTEAKQGVDPLLIYNGLEQLIETLKQNYMYVILLGSRAPDEVDLSYATRFNSMYVDIAKRQQVAFYPDIYTGLRNHRDTFVTGGYVPTKYGINYAVSALGPHLQSILNTLSKRYP